MKLPSGRANRQVTFDLTLSLLNMRFTLDLAFLLIFFLPSCYGCDPGKICIQVISADFMVLVQVPLLHHQSYDYPGNNSDGCNNDVGLQECCPPSHLWGEDPAWKSPDKCNDPIKVEQIFLFLPLPPETSFDQPPSTCFAAPTSFNKTSEGLFPATIEQ